MMQVLADRPLVGAVLGGVVAWLIIIGLQVVVLHRTAVVDLLVGCSLFAASAFLLLLVLAVKAAPPSGEHPPPQPAKRGAGVETGRYGLVPLPLAVALQPDFDAFFGGLEVAVVSGFVLVVALVVVQAVKRLVSF